MMRTLVMLMVGALLVPGLAAQEGGAPDSPRAERLRAEIERRFSERVRETLGLSDDQVGKLRATQERFRERRRPLMQQQMGLRRALREQMRPGEAADPDSVRSLMDGIRAGRARMFELEQQEDRELAGYLTPVQQARFLMMRDRFHRHVREMRREGGGRHGPGGPGGRSERDGPRRHGPAGPPAR